MNWIEWIGIVGLSRPDKILLKGIFQQESSSIVKNAFLLIVPNEKRKNILELIQQLLTNGYWGKNSFHVVINLSQLLHGVPPGIISIDI